MPEKLIEKLIGRTIEVAYCEKCDTFKPLKMNVESTNARCPVCDTVRVKCDITIEGAEA